MKKLIITLLLLSGCGSEPVKEVEIIEEVKPLDITAPINACKELEKPRYSKQFSELVCALRESKQNLPLKEIVLAQWILESGRGNSRLASKFFNFGGLKWRKEMAPYATKISYKAWDGKTDYIRFKNAADFVKGYWHFIDRYPYNGWKEFENSPHEYIKFINHAGYTPPKDYYKKVIVLEKEAARLLEGN